MVLPFQRKAAIAPLEVWLVPAIRPALLTPYAVLKFPPKVPRLCICSVTVKDHGDGLSFCIGRAAHHFASIC